jgi:hypothetical protein
MKPPLLPTHLAHDHPAVALAAIPHLRRLLDRLEHEHVIALRQQGYNWADIARILGITRQAARERFMHWDPTQT